MNEEEAEKEEEVEEEAGKMRKWINNGGKEV